MKVIAIIVGIVLVGGLIAGISAPEIFTYLTEVFGQFADWAVEFFGGLFNQIKDTLQKPVTSESTNIILFFFC